MCNLVIYIYNLQIFSLNETFSVDKSMQCFLNRFVDQGCFSINLLASGTVDFLIKSAIQILHGSNWLLYFIK